MLMFSTCTASDPAAGWGGEGARNVKSMWLPLAAIFFMTYLYRAGGGWAWPPRHPPGSATDVVLFTTEISSWFFSRCLNISGRCCWNSSDCNHLLK